MTFQRSKYKAVWFETIRIYARDGVDNEYSVFTLNKQYMSNFFQKTLSTLINVLYRYSRSFMSTRAIRPWHKLSLRRI